MYTVRTSNAGSRPLMASEISRRVLSVTCSPRIFSDFGVMPKMSQPPSVFRKAHAECIPSFSSPVLFFISSSRCSSSVINFWMSSIVMVSIYCRFAHSSVSHAMTSAVHFR